MDPFHDTDVDADTTSTSSDHHLLHPDDTSDPSRRRRHLAKLASHLKRENLKEARDDAKNKDEEGRHTGLAAGSTEGIVASGDTIDTSTPGPSGGFASGLQDKLFAKMIGQVLPPDTVQHYSGLQDKRKDKDRPPFSISLMSSNFRRFNQRIGVVFVFQHRLIRILTWKHPTHTISAMALYSFICLDPYLLAAVPLAVVLLFIMVPAYISRHPPPPSNLPTDPYSSHGPPSAAPPEVKAVSELSKDFFRNLRDLQNSMDDFSTGHDQVIQLIGPPTNFSSETLSSGVFLLLFLTTCVLFIAARHIPWRPVLLITGWIGILLSHPKMQTHLHSAHEKHLKPREKMAKKRFKAFVAKDIILDALPDEREVEIFELQKKDSRGEWENWMFSPHPYEKLSAARLSGDKPKGTRFFEDVRPPRGWEWRDPKWTLDLGSQDWVEERYIEGVEVEIAEERWVYDILRGDEGYRGTGEWRRRRWLRTARRHVIRHNEFEAVDSIAF